MTHKHNFFTSQKEQYLAQQTRKTHYTEQYQSIAFHKIKAQLLAEADHNNLEYELFLVKTTPELASLFPNCLQVFNIVNSKKLCKTQKN